jgi:hypothetical protein
MTGSERMFRRVALAPVLGVLAAGCGSDNPPQGTPIPAADAGEDVSAEAAPDAALSIQQRMSQVKVAIVYERLSDGIGFGRSVDDVADLVVETQADLIFRAFFRWQPVPESPESILASSCGLPSDYVAKKAAIGYTYKQYADALHTIKAARPDVLVVGAIAAQRLNAFEIDDSSSACIGPDGDHGTWSMAFDPTTLQLGVTKNALQCEVGKDLGFVDRSFDCTGYDHATSASAYFPDITNQNYHDLVLAHAKKQIDLGVDAIWIDMFFVQALVLSKKFPGNPSAAQSAHEAASRIVDDIHAYGTTKYNKRIAVGTWWNNADLPYAPPDLDFVTATASYDEVEAIQLQDSWWTTTQATIAGKWPTIPVFVDIDWGNGATPMFAFSQDLSPAQQCEFCTMADDFLAKKGMVFVYPVHGGTFQPKPEDGGSGGHLCWGFGTYDSLYSPDCYTYPCIKQLAQGKK